MAYDKPGTFSEYRRLIFKMLEDREKDIEKLEKETRQELRETGAKVSALKSEVDELKNNYSQAKFKLNLWQALVASIPGWIAIGLAIFRK